MIQLGRHPRFFNHTNPINIEEMNIQIWKGFKFSAYKYSDTCALILDDCCRFMSTKTVMNRMDEIYDDSERKFPEDFHHHFQEECRREFIG